jgi:hypothetical protein
LHVAAGLRRTGHEKKGGGKKLTPDALLSVGPWGREGVNADQDWRNRAEYANDGAKTRHVFDTGPRSSRFQQQLNGGHCFPPVLGGVVEERGRGV